MSTQVLQGMPGEAVSARDLVESDLKLRPEAAARLLRHFAGVESLALLDPRTHFYTNVCAHAYTYLYMHAHGSRHEAMKGSIRRCSYQ